MMKRLIILLMVACWSCGSLLQAQSKRMRNLTPDFEIEGVLKQPYQYFKKGTPVILQRLVDLQANGQTSRQGVISIEGKQYSIPMDVMRSTLELKPTDANSFWMAYQLQGGLIEYYEKHGLQPEMRKELEEDARSYLDELQKNQLLYEDVALEDYIHCLMLDMMPHQFLAKRYGTPYVRILKSPNPDLLMLGNGCLLISTGMLTLLDSEEELYALMSREIAHFVLDHAVITVNKNTARARRYEFWSSVAEAAAFCTEVYLSEKHENYIPGIVYTTAGIVDVLIGENIMKRMGLDYQPDQEEDADRIATLYLQSRHRDPSLLTAALQKVEQYYLNTQDNSVFHRYAIHGSLGKRLKKLQQKHPATGHPEDRIYLKQTATVVSFSAGMMAYNGDYTQATTLAQKNVQTHLASADDYVILAQCLMKQENNPETLATCQTLLEKADQLNGSPSINATRQRVLLLLRQQKQEEAVEQLKLYVQLTEKLLSRPQTEADQQWLNSENQWAQQLIGRLEAI